MKIFFSGKAEKRIQPFFQPFSRKYISSFFVEFSKKRKKNNFFSEFGVNFLYFLQSQKLSPKNSNNPLSLFLCFEAAAPKGFFPILKKKKI